MPLKTYVLLPHMKPTAPIFIQVSPDQRTQIDTIPEWSPYLQVTFLDERKEVTDYDPDSQTLGKLIANKWKGKNRTARLKLNSNTPWQDEQIEKEKIPANEKFTQNEYAARIFRHNVLATNNPAVQRFLENIPEMEGFEGYCDSIKKPSYKLYVKSVEISGDNKLFKKRLEAANKIASLGLEESKDLLIRIYGTAYQVPSSEEEAQNALVSFMDSSDEAVTEILKEDTTIDDDVNILLGRLVSEGRLSFEAVQGAVAKKKGTEWITLREISNEYDPNQRQKYFVEFLTSPAGKLMLNDLEKEAGIKAKTKKE